MQNLPNEAGRNAPGPLRLPLAALAQPKVVLMTAGLVGLAVDLFVRPLSWIGLALIALATAPWMLQAWSQRSAPAASPHAIKGTANLPGDQRRDQQVGAPGHRVETARLEPGPPTARDAPRPAPQADPAARMPTHAPAREARAALPRAPQESPPSSRPQETSPPRRQVRPQTAG